MNPNEGRHNHHRSGYNRSNNKHQRQQQQQQQQQQHGNPYGGLLHHQIAPFGSNQVQPLTAMPYHLQQQTQHPYFNPPSQNYVTNVSLSHEINPNQSVQINYNPAIPSQLNTAPPQSNWYTPLDVHSSNPSIARSIDPSMPSNSLSQLQLPANQITENGIIPNAPYYELPAGLMVPLIAPSQREYKPLDPTKLRLPLPKFPDENFLRFIDSYYVSDGKVRDNDGWDRDFINTFIGQKAALAESETMAN